MASLSGASGDVQGSQLRFFFALGLTMGGATLDLEQAQKKSEYCEFT
ncbi:MAG: hypothetical protein V3V08_11225 [Nannocystaceae bacterium]